MSHEWIYQGVLVVQFERFANSMTIHVERDNLYFDVNYKIFFESQQVKSTLKWDMIAILVRNHFPV